MLLVLFITLIIFRVRAQRCGKYFNQPRIMRKKLSGLFLLAATLSFSGCADEPLRSIRPVADRLLDDTLFELSEQPAKYPLFPTILTPHDAQSVCMLRLPSDSTYRLGFSAVEGAKVCVDDRTVLDVRSSGRAFPREVAYDTYLFDDYVELYLACGEHRVEVKSTGIVSFGVVDSLDFPASGVSYSVIEHESGGKEFRIPIKKKAAFTKHSYAEWHYANGATMLGLSALADATGELRYAEHVRRFCDFTMEYLPLFAAQYDRGLLRTQNYRLFRRGMLDDTTAPALPLLEVAMRYGATEEQRRLLASMADYAMHGQPRLADGTFVRPEPRWTIWCDDLFMSAVFLVRYARFTGDESYLEEAVRQAKAYDRYLRDPETGLVFHGWDDTHKRFVGQRWGRANGWFAWAPSEILSGLPSGHPDYRQLSEIHRSHLEALLCYQESNGMWHQLLDRPDTYEETSATALFVLTLARAVRMGWVDRSYAERALLGWQAIEKHIRPDGTVTGICRSMSIGNDVAVYAERPTLPNDPRGLGAVFTAAVEVDALRNYLKHENIQY